MCISLTYKLRGGLTQQGGKEGRSSPTRWALGPWSGDRHLCGSFFFIFILIFYFFNFYFLIFIWLVHLCLVRIGLRLSLAKNGSYPLEGCYPAGPLRVLCLTGIAVRLSDDLSHTSTVLWPRT